MWDLILDEIEAGRVIPVLGRALLTFGEGEKVESLDELLARRLAANLKLPESLIGKRPTLEKVICSYQPFRGNLLLAQTSLRAIYQEVFKSANPPPRPEPLRQLAEIQDFHLFVSLTIDDLLEEAVEKARGLAPGKAISISNAQRSTPDLDDLQLTSKTPIVFRLLGKIEKGKEFALTDEDILEFLYNMQSPEGRPKRLFQEFREKDLLFIGTHFPDWQALFFLRAARGERLRKERGFSDFVVESMVTESTRFGSFLANHATPMTHFFQIEPREFVRELHARWSERNRQKALEKEKPTSRPGPATLFSEGPHDVFVSYAQEDRDSAERVYQRLTDAGLNVWLDNASGLEWGNDYDRKIRHAIARCEVFVALLSAHVLIDEGRFFRREWSYANDRRPDMYGLKRDFIHPVIVDEADERDRNFTDVFPGLTIKKAPQGDLPPELVSKIVREVRRHQVVRR